MTMTDNKTNADKPDKPKFPTLPLEPVEGRDSLFNITVTEPATCGTGEHSKLYGPGHPDPLAMPTAEEATKFSGIEPNHPDAKNAIAGLMNARLPNVSVRLGTEADCPSAFVARAHEWLRLHVGAGTDNPDFAADYVVRNFAPYSGSTLMPASLGDLSVYLRRSGHRLSEYVIALDAGDLLQRDTYCATLRRIASYGSWWDMLTLILTRILQARRAARGKPEVLATIPYADWRVVMTMRTLRGYTTRLPDVVVAPFEHPNAAPDRVAKALRELMLEPVALPAGLIPIVGHYLHVSKDSRPGSVMWAYVESDAKGQADVQTPIKPGKYLTKFYPHLSHDDVTRLVNLINGGGKPPEVLFAKTPDEFEKVYREGPWSCMHYYSGKFDTYVEAGRQHMCADADTRDKDEWGNAVKNHIHPAKAYATRYVERTTQKTAEDGTVTTLTELVPSENPKDQTDLQLAYWYEPDPTQGYQLAITARALVWPAKKYYGRIYGGYKNRSDGNNATTGTDNTAIKDRFAAALASLGYTSPKQWNSLDGARIRKIRLGGKLADGDLRLVMPYIDGSRHRFDITDTHVVINNAHGDYDFEEGSTSGQWSQEENSSSADEYSCACDCCGDGCDETWTIYTRDDQSREEYWCESCRADGAWRCEFSDEHFSDSVSSEDVVTRIRVPAGSAWCERSLRRERWTAESAQDPDNAFECALLGEYVSASIPPIEVVVDSDGSTETWALPCAEHNALSVLYPGPSGDPKRVYYKDAKAMTPDVYLLWQVQQGRNPEALDTPDGMTLAEAKTALSRATPAGPGDLGYWQLAATILAAWEAKRDAERDAERQATEAAVAAANAALDKLGEAVLNHALSETLSETDTVPVVDA